MTTVALLRTGYLNAYLRRADASLAPWTDAVCNQHLTEALTQLFQDGIGKRVQGTVATSQNSDIYTIPAAIVSAVGAAGKVSRIELEQSSGGITQRADRITDWQMYSETQVRITPMLPTNASLLLRFFGYAPYDPAGSDLPVRLEAAVAMKAAALAYGSMTGLLVNAQNQQGLDQGRVVDYQTAVSLSAYWERRYQQVISRDQAMMSFAPRRSRR